MRLSMSVPSGQSSSATTPKFAASVERSASRSVRCSCAMDLTTSAPKGICSSFPASGAGSSTAGSSSASASASAGSCGCGAPAPASAGSWASCSSSSACGCTATAVPFFSKRLRIACSSEAFLGPPPTRRSSFAERSCGPKGFTRTWDWNLPPKAPGSMSRCGRPFAAKGPCSWKVWRLKRKSWVRPEMRCCICSSSFGGEPKSCLASHSCCVLEAQMKT
mmetsp:Transcript_122722/g.381427  ORF Transcript_122722/g.381427 Transcript_122722/m.381427 type:complete len:220 (+) Transcript_122722:83-742(+)